MRAKRVCTNYPLCPARIARRNGYCPACKALRKLVTKILGDKPNKPTKDRYVNDAGRREEIHRGRSGPLVAHLERH